MNIIILIIANDDNESYIEMQQIWRKYMNNHSNIKSYFIKLLDIRDNSCIASHINCCGPFNPSSEHLNLSSISFSLNSNILKALLKPICSIIFPFN